MNKKQCEKILKEILQPYTKQINIINETEILNMNLVTDLDLDSFVFVQLLVDIEEKFGISIDDETDITKLVIFSDLVDAIYEKKLSEDNIL